MDTKMTPRKTQLGRACGTVKRKATQIAPDFIFLELKPVNCYNMLNKWCITCIAKNKRAQKEASQTSAEEQSDTTYQKKTKLKKGTVLDIGGKRGRPKQTYDKCGPSTKRKLDVLNKQVKNL